GFLPVVRVCHPPPFLGRTRGISRVPVSALVTCHGLRPREVRGSHGRPGSWEVAFREANHVGTYRFIAITGLNPFTLAHCRPSPPCVRFALAVTDNDATRGTRCLAKASGAEIFPQRTEPSFARRTSLRLIPTT